MTRVDQGGSLHLAGKSGGGKLGGNPLVARSENAVQKHFVTRLCVGANPPQHQLQRVPYVVDGTSGMEERPDHETPLILKGGAFRDVVVGRLLHLLHAAGTHLLPSPFPLGYLDRLNDLPHVGAYLQQLLEPPPQLGVDVPHVHEGTSPQ